MNYHHFYDVQFVFDQDSIKALGNQGGNDNKAEATAKAETTTKAETTAKVEIITRK